MKKWFTLAMFIAATLQMHSQEKKFKFDIYGQIRMDAFYNSRANEESVDGLFYSYPKDHNYDPNGNDLNGTPQGYFYSMYSRIGVNIKGPKIGNAKTSAKLEMDFRGSGTTLYVPRLRFAYINFEWKHSDLLLGQNWHPLFGEVSPSVINLSSGSPFQPFSRAPQLRYRYFLDDKFTLTAAAIWQSQYMSMGPEGRSNKYLKNSCMPEFFLGYNYKKDGFICGIGGELLSIVPRTQAIVDLDTYKVKERVTSISGMLQLKYAAPKWQVSGKTVIANNLTQVNTLGGFGVTSVNPHNGEKKYTPFTHSLSWLNFTYGKKWQPGVFCGYIKNLGTGKAITGEIYGVGLDVDQIFTSFVQLSYNLSCLKIGAELGASTAWYGNLDKSNGRITDTHSVTNYRAVASVFYIF